MRHVSVFVIQGVNAIPKIDGRTKRGFDLQRCHAKTVDVFRIRFRICSMQDRVIVSSTYGNAVLLHLDYGVCSKKHECF